jgi:hypothetical protein
MKDVVIGKIYFVLTENLAMFELMDCVPNIWRIRDCLVVSDVNDKVCSDIYGPEPSDGKMATAHI